MKSALEGNQKVAKRLKKGLGDNFVDQGFSRDGGKLALPLKLVDAGREQS